MAKFRTYWSVVALVLIFLVGVVMRELAPTPVQAMGSAPVTIQNTPLPVMGTVGVNNFPATQDVNVTNTMPVPVTAADNPAFHPMQEYATGTFDSSGLCTTTLATVGSGKRLVIEYASAQVVSTTGQKLFFIDIKASGVFNFLAPSYQADNGTVSSFMASQATRIYANPGTDVVGQASGPTTMAGSTCAFSFSGYLVTLP
ncbi:MAG TPA: hypothetical protein VGR73_14465 [Bryobacteraceae bacterium]|nr:hypothetical protein [Bryobacteraceae bacterium]